jgi:peptidoglycan-associated lipoprotein
MIEQFYFPMKKKEMMMMKKFWILATLLLVLPALMLTVSCAKKAVKKAPVVAEVEEKADDTAKTGMSEAELKAQAEERARLAALNRFENEHVYFSYDSSALDGAAQNTLKLKADWLQENPDAGILIEGHCDERGTVEYNLALGDRRANSAKNFLTTLGIDAARISTISYGEERPLDPGENEEAWAKNRRAQFDVK